MKRFSIILLSLSVLIRASAQVSYIYRNDSTAHRIEEGILYSHPITSSTLINSIEAGDITVPIDKIDSIMGYSADVPMIEIDLSDYPQAKELWDKELYLKAKVNVKGNGLIDDLGPVDAKIKGRGNTTWNMAKKPYRIKFDKKIQIGDLKKGKNLVLLANYIDPTLMKNALTFEIAKGLGVPYVNNYTPCLVRINGVDKGAYLMTEKVGISSASVDIDETKGILFELSTEFDEPYQFKSSLYKLPVMVKDPDFDELAENDPSLTPEQRLSIWQEDFYEAEKSVRAMAPERCFDIESFINYLLVFDIARNMEIGHPKSVFIHKAELGKDSLYHFGPIWDFDYAYDKYDLINGKDVAVSPNLPLGMHDFFVLMKMASSVKERYRERLIYFIKEVYPDILKWIDSYAALVRPSAKVNGTQWLRDNSTYTIVYSSFKHEEHVEKLKDWLNQRIAYLCSTNNITDEDLN